MWWVHHGPGTLIPRGSPAVADLNPSVRVGPLHQPIRQPHHPGKRMQMRVARVSQQIAFGRLLEQQPEWIWATIESQDHTARAAAATAA